LLTRQECEIWEIPNGWIEKGVERIDLGLPVEEDGEEKPSNDDGGDGSRFSPTVKMIGRD